MAYYKAEPCRVRLCFDFEDVEISSSEKSFSLAGKLSGIKPKQEKIL
jgi:hypothetical protein